MRLFLLLLISISIICCKSEDKDSPMTPEVSLIEKGVAASGGWDNWKGLDSIQFYKMSKLFLEDGTLEDSTYQLHTYYMYPKMEGKFSWDDGDDNYEVRYTKSRTSKYKNGVDMQLTPEESEKLRLSFLGSQFVMSMPFKLGDPGVVLAMDGKSNINGKKVDVLKASYNAENSNHTKTHDWWYYFDSESAALEGYKVYHAPTYARVANVTTTSVKGITFPTYRKSFRTDVNDKELFVRAEFWYTYVE